MKVILDDVQNVAIPSAVTTLQDNNDKIEEGFQNTISRDGSGPNTMLSDFDMNNNRILNLLPASYPEEPVRLKEFEEALENIRAGSSTNVIGATIGYNGNVTSLDNFLSTTRASTGWSLNDLGVYTEAAVDTSRRNSRGRLIEGGYTNLVYNPTWTGASGFHSGLPARIQPVVTSGVITGVTILDGGTGYTTPPAFTVTGTGGSGFSGTCVLTSGVVTSVTITTGGTGYPSDTGGLVSAGTMPAGWRTTISQGNVGGISLVGLQTINGLPALIVRWNGNANGRNLSLRGTLTSSTVNPGDYVSTSMKTKIVAGSLSNVDLVGTIYTLGGSAQTTYRADLLRDYPNDINDIENPGTLVQAGVTTIASPQFITSGVTAGTVYDITLALFPFTIAVAPVVTSPIALTPALVFGSELLTNGDFSMGGPPPSLGSGWTISGGTATRTANGGVTSYLPWTPITLTAGTKYQSSFDILDIAGTGYAYLTGGTTLTGSPKTAVGTQIDVFTAVAGNNGYRFGGATSSTMTVDNFSLKSVSGPDGLTRLPDVVTLDTISFSRYFNKTGFALAVDGEFERGESPVSRIMFQIDDVTDNNRITVRTVAGTEAFIAEVAVAGVVTAMTVMSRSVLVGRRFRVILTGNQTSVDLTVDGGITQSISTPIPTLKALRLGNNVALTLPFNGRIHPPSMLDLLPQGAQKTYWSLPAARIGEEVPAVATVDDSFMVVPLPDVHVSTSTTSTAEWGSIWKYIIAQKAAQRIEAVISEGDIVVNGTAPEFVNAAPGYQAIVDANIPFVINYGNHDGDGPSTFTSRVTMNFNNAFPVSMFSGKSWFGGTMAGETKNMWSYFDVLLATGVTRKFLMLSLDLDPDNNTLDWGLGVCLANLDREVLFVTHSYLDPDGTLTLNADPNGWNSRPFPGNPADVIWDRLGRKAPNMKFIVSGHQYLAPAIPTSYLLSLGDAGNRVHQYFCNYQNCNGGNGVLAMLRFHSNSDIVDILAYSTLTGTPYLDSVLKVNW